MGIEIIPPGASAVVTKNKRNRDCGDGRGWNRGYGNHGYDGNDRYDGAEEARMADRFCGVNGNIKDATAVLNQVGADRFIKVLEDIKSSAAAGALAGAHSVEIAQNNAFAGERSASQTREKISDGLRGVSEGVTSGFKDSTAGVTGGFKDVALGQCHTVDAVNSASYAVRELVNFGFKDVALGQSKGFCDTQTLVQLSLKDSLTTAYQLNAVTERAAAENQKNTMLQFKDVQLLQEKLYASQTLQAERLAAQAAKEAAECCCELKIQAERLAAQAAKEAAECCCELKELMCAENGQTRALINSIEADRLRERASKAEAALAAYFAAKVAPVAPV